MALDALIFSQKEEEEQNTLRGWWIHKHICQAVFFMPKGSHHLHHAELSSHFSQLILLKHSQNLVRWLTFCFFKHFVPVPSGTPPLLPWGCSFAVSRTGSSSSSRSLRAVFSRLEVRYPRPPTTVILTSVGETPLFPVAGVEILNSPGLLTFSHLRKAHWLHLSK